MSMLHSASSFILGMGVERWRQAEIRRKMQGDRVQDMQWLTFDGLYMRVGMSQVKTETVIDGNLSTPHTPSSLNPDLVWNTDSKQDSPRLQRCFQLDKTFILLRMIPCPRWYLKSKKFQLLYLGLEAPTTYRLEHSKKGKPNSSLLFSTELT